MNQMSQCLSKYEINYISINNFVMCLKVSILSTIIQQCIYIQLIYINIANELS